jgi:hypothetical protein
MTETKVKSTTRAQDKAQNNQERVIAVLGWDHDQYCEYQFEQGITFLRHYIGEKTPYGEVLLQSRIFWNWWKNQWALRDSFFLSRMKLIERCCTAEMWYTTTNDGINLAGNIHPNRAVLDLSYAEMTQEFIAEEKLKQ